MVFSPFIESVFIITLSKNGGPLRIDPAETGIMEPGIGPAIPAKKRIRRVPGDRPFFAERFPSVRSCIIANEIVILIGRTEGANA